MAITLRAEADFDDAKRGLQDLGQTADQAGKTAADGAKRADNAVDELARSEERAGDAAESAGERAEVSTEKLRHEVEMAENAFGDLKDSAERAADAVDDIGDRAKKAGDDVDRMGNSFAEVDGVLDLIKESAQFAYEALQAMAENGNPGAQRLMGSLEKIQQALLQIGENTRAQQNMENMANVIDDGVIPAINAMGDAANYAYDKFNQWNAFAAVGLLEVIGAVERGTTRILLADQQRAELAVQLAAKAKEEAAAKEGIAAATAKATDASTQALDVEKELEAIAHSRKVAEQQANMARVDSIGPLEDYVKKMTEFAKNEKNDLEQRKLALEYLRNAEARILELKRQQVDPAAELKKLDEERAEARRKQEIQDEKDIDNIDWRIGRQRDIVQDEKASDADKRKALQEIRDLEQRRNELAQERAALEKKEADDKAAHAKTVQAELDRINGLENDKAMSRKEIEERIFEINGMMTGQLTKFAKNRDEELKLLKEMETLKRRLLELDRQAAAAQEKAKEEQRQAASDRASEAQSRKDQFAQTREGQMLGAMASSPEAIRDRIAKDSGRKRGTVAQMMRRGDISEAELAAAARKNFDDLYGQFQQQGQNMGVQVGNAMRGQNATIGAMMNRQDLFDQELARLKSEQNAMNQAARSREENTRRRLNGR